MPFTAYTTRILTDFECNANTQRQQRKTSAIFCRAIMTRLATYYTYYIIWRCIIIFNIYFLPLWTAVRSKLGFHKYFFFPRCCCTVIIYSVFVILFFHLIYCVDWPSIIISTHVYNLKRSFFYFYSIIILYPVLNEWTTEYI